MGEKQADADGIDLSFGHRRSPGIPINYSPSQRPMPRAKNLGDHHPPSLKSGTTIANKLCYSCASFPPGSSIYTLL